MVAPKDPDREMYTTFDQPWWANDMLILVFALFSVILIVIDMETSLRTTNPGIWWALAIIDLGMVGFFLADLIEDRSRCIDKGWWWRRNWWEFLGLVPMMVMALQDVEFLATSVALFSGLRWLRILRAFSAIVRLLSTTRKIGPITVKTQISHLGMIVAILIFTGGFMTYVFELEAHTTCIKDEFREKGQDEMASNYKRGDQVEKEIWEVCNAEHTLNSLGESLWWAIVTTTTVGYGHSYPVTLGGRLVATVLMMVGIGVVGMLAATLSQALYGQTTMEIHRRSDLREELLRTLEMMAELHIEGELTDAEYNQIKSQLISQINDIEDEVDTSAMPMPMRVAAQMRRIESFDESE